ncbi:SwmB domain-containing protein [Gelidibacter salicanalis]|uniref:DUF5689 domain-containing protein n=1 Tax=Gelidibacter salicanalis TaxID=291193 RepID=A0A934NDC6_9FLAO|nr:SwmB domain-containing protein [Gelidibacter salicanalis]MBJ7881580.1 hypothetical protein [Gelidibacter salicanalis]
MKKIIYTVLTLVLILTFSCDSDEYEAPFGDFSSHEWITTSGFEETDYVLALNDYIGFRDVSRNAIEHSWSIPSGTRILSNDFTENDSIYASFIVGNGPGASDQKLLNLLFVESGVKEVVLRNVYRNQVENSVELNGKWVVEERFTVNVFDDVKPSFKVMRGIEEILSVSETDFPNAANSASWPTVTIEAGEQLTYIDLTTVGMPDTRTWTFNGGNIQTSNAATANVFYNGLGNFLAGSINSRRANADKPDGEAIKVIPLKIEVIPSTQPFIINGSLTESASEIISFDVTGELASVAGEEGNFVVNVMNAVTEFNQNIPVQTVAINGSNATQIDLTLSAPIFNSDVITVTYTEGNIKSIDSRVLQSFGPETVQMFFEGSMNIAGFTGYEVEWEGSGNQFKKANTEGYFAQHNGNSEAGPLYYYRDTSMPYEGNSSMKFETPTSGIPNLARLQGSQFSTLSPVNSGTYVPSVWIYIDAATTLNTIDYNFTDGPRLSFDISSAPKEKWVQLKLPEITLGDIDSGRLDIEIGKTGQDDEKVQKLWLDNFDLLIIELRK